MIQALMIVADCYQLDRRVLHEAQSLAARGYPVHILSLVPGMVKPRNIPFNTVLCEPSHGSGNGRGSCSALHFKARLVRGCKAITKTLLPKKAREILLFPVLDPAHRIARSFESWGDDRWDIIMAHDLPLLPLALTIRRRQGFGKVILDAHELYDEQHDQLTTRTARNYWRAIENRYLPQCDGVITVTERLAEELASRHRLAIRPTVLHNACPHLPDLPAGDCLRKLYEIPEGKRIVLCQGGLVPGRSLEEFIRAWNYIPEPRPALVFLGFGQSDYVRKLQRMAAASAHKEDIFIGKAVPPDQVLHFTCGADLGLISNRGRGLNNTDGAPNRLFEYVQARVPVLSYEHNGVERFLRMTGTGWVVAWKSARQLANLIMDKLSEAESLSLEQLNRAAEMLSWEKEESKLLDLISAVHSGRKPSA